MLLPALMFQKIEAFANDHPDILAAYLNGSRTNPTIAPDLYQDYDLVYVVKSTAPYIQDKSWISYFGEIAVMQEPDCQKLFPSNADITKQYAYLMQFQNGDRIDLTFQVPEVAQTACLADRLTIKLFDKAGVLPAIPPASDETHHVQLPSQNRFAARCNEFWWVAPYVAKGLWRGELLYAMDMLSAVRGELLTMLSWEVAARNGHALSTGKSCKFLLRYLDAATAEQLAQTFPALRADAMWEALQATCSLMGSTARRVAALLNLHYDADEEARCLTHLENVRLDRYQLEDFHD